MKRFHALVLAAGLAVAAAPAQAALIGLSSSSPGRLFDINPLTGAATLIVTMSNATSLVGLEALNGNLYGTDVVANGFKFGSIDINTGAFTVINNQAGSANWHGLAANEATDTFYVIDINDGNKLKSVDLAGAVTTIGSGAGIDGRGMAFDDGSGILYATGSSGLYTVNTTSGLASFIGGMGIGTGLIGLAYDELFDVLYANNGSSLYKVNTGTGAATLIGANGSGFNIDGLAWLGAGQAPEPASLALVALGLLGLGVLRRAAATAHRAAVRPL